MRWVDVEVGLDVELVVGRLRAGRARRRVGIKSSSSSSSLSLSLSDEDAAEHCAADDEDDDEEEDDDDTESERTRWAATAAGFHLVVASGGFKVNWDASMDAIASSKLSESSSCGEEGVEGGGS